MDTMAPLTYSLCHKPVLGLLMFVASACAFPPLVSDAPFPLQQEGASAAREFEAPVSKPYSLLLSFSFPSAAASYRDEVVGSRSDESCGRAYDTISTSQRTGLGRPIPIHVLIRERATGSIKVDRVVNTLCLSSSGGPGFQKNRTAARIELAAGKYLVELRNMESQAGLDGVKTTFSIVSGGGK